MLFLKLFATNTAREEFGWERPVLEDCPLNEVNRGLAYPPCTEIESLVHTDGHLLLHLYMQVRFLTTAGLVISTEIY